MSNAIYKKDLHDVALAVAQGSKNYTDKTKEEIYWHIGDYSISTQTDSTTASTKTVPSGATRCKIKKIYGLTEKFNPSVAYDNASTMTKTMPNVVYDFDCSVVYGNSEVSENLSVLNDVAETTTNGITYSVSNGVVNLKTGTSTQATYLNLGTFILSAGTYYLKAFGNNAGTYQTYFAVLQDNQSQNIAFSYDSTSSGTFTLNATTTLNYVIVIRNAISVSNIQFKDMVISGSTAPTEFKQGFTGIHNLELTGLKVEGANLFDKDTYTYQNGKSLNDNGEIINNSSSWRAIEYYMPIQENTTYTLSGTAIGTQDWGTRIAFYDENHNQISQTRNSGIVNIYTFTTPSGTRYWRYSWAIATDTSDWILNLGSTALDYVPYIAPTTKTIDLSTILYNGSPLFEGNSLKGVGTSKDSVSPYKARKEAEQLVVDSNTRYNYIASNFGGCTIILDTDKKTTTTNRQVKVSGSVESNIDTSWIGDAAGNFYIKFITPYESEQALKQALLGTIFIYNLATPIEVSIDWSSTLRGIQGYSNGTITLQNTYNMDTANTITYNSIIKENCCAKIVQSRGGNVVKTINLPTTSSDGYSAGSASNVRDLTTNKRYTNVDKNSNIGGLSYTYNSQYSYFKVTTNIGIKIVGYSTTTNSICAKYEAIAQSNFQQNDNVMFIVNSDNIAFKDTKYDNATTFKTAMANIPLYYELADASKTESDITAIDNIIEVQPNDVLSFYDSNDNLVTVPSDLTYRIEVERV